MRGWNRVEVFVRYYDDKPYWIGGKRTEVFMSEGIQEDDWLWFVKDGHETLVRGVVDTRVEAIEEADAAAARLGWVEQ